MRLRPGTPLSISVAFEGPASPMLAARATMADGLAQLEWQSAVIEACLRVSPIDYPPEPGLFAARTRSLDGLHGFLADSLPEAWGQALMRRQLAKHGASYDDLSGLDRLALVGDQGRGALTFAPAGEVLDTPNTLDLDDLAEGARAILVGEDSSLSATLARLGGASGGARPKVHLGLGEEGAASASYGEVAADHAAWIVKFPAPGDPPDIGAIEASYAAMAGLAGLEMSPFRLLPAREGSGYFAARRFDRPSAGQRLHLVSLGGVLGVAPLLPSSYETLLRATWAITRDVRAVKSAFRRMVFNVFACNRDDHTRQHSFLMSPDGEWSLAPAYDLTHSRGPGGEHYLDIDGEARTIHRDRIYAVGLRHGLKEAEIVDLIDQVLHAVSRWGRLADEFGVSRASRQRVFDAIREVDSQF